MRPQTRRLAAVPAIVGAAAAVLAHAAPPPTQPVAPNSADRGPNWVKVAEDGQRLYFLEENAATSAAPRSGKAELRSLMQFKIPQVLQATQVWSLVSSLQLDCDRGQALTVSDTFYSGKLGTGRAVSFRASSDAWHTPAPGSLGEMAWNVACGRSAPAR